MKTTVEPHKVTHNGAVRWRVCIPAALQQVHQGTRRFFIGERQARDFAKILNNARQSWSAQLTALPEATQGRLLLLLDKAGSIEALEATMQDGLKSVVGSKVLLSDAIQQFLSVKRGENLSEKHIGQLEKLLARMLSRHDAKSKLVSEFSVSDWQDFIDSNGWGATSKHTVWGQVGAFWSWAVDSKLIKERPMPGKRPAKDEAPKGILSIEDIAQILRTAARLDPALVSYFAIGIFAGLRPSEIERLTSANLIDDEIQILDGKTGSRFAHIDPLLRSWLNVNSSLAWEKLAARRSAVIEASGVSWSHDCMRHSYCSYSVPVLGENQVSRNCGHSVDVLHKHYAKALPKGVWSRFHSGELSPASVLNPEIKVAA